jgi:hypothetical protein
LLAGSDLGNSFGLAFDRLRTESVLAIRVGHSVRRCRSNGLVFTAQSPHRNDSDDEGRRQENVARTDDQKRRGLETYLPEVHGRELDLCQHHGGHQEHGADPRKRSATNKRQGDQRQDPQQMLR